MYENELILLSNNWVPINVTQILASIISAGDVVTTVVGAVGIGAILAGGVPPTPVQPGTVPQGVPQPGAGKCLQITLRSVGIFWEHTEYVNLCSDFTVGGGSPFPTTPTTGPEAIAAGLAPSGTLPVAFFPAVQGQSVSAFSVIFSESIVVGKRKKRSVHRGNGRMGNFEFSGVYGNNFVILKSFNSKDSFSTLILK